MVPRAGGRSWSDIRHADLQRGLACRRMRRPLILLVGIMALAACPTRRAATTPRNYRDDGGERRLPTVHRVHGASTSTGQPTSPLNTTPRPRPTQPAYPGAATSVTTWADFDGCHDQFTQDHGHPRPRLGAARQGTVLTLVGGCPDGIGVELWTLEGGSHNPDIGFADGSRPISAGIIEWLLRAPETLSSTERTTFAVHERVGSPRTERYL